MGQSSTLEGTGAAPDRRGGMRLMQDVVARASFPVVLGGATLWALASMQAGTAPEIAILAPMLSAYVVIAALERFFFWREGWLHSKGDLHVDVGHLIVSGILANEALKIPVRYLAILGAAWIAERTSGGLWPTHWNVWLQLALALVYGEFFLYWIHRLTHEIDFLWRFHATHHSAPRLYFLNAARFHPVDLVLSSLVPLAALLLVGADARIIALFGLVSAVHGLFQHANLVLHLGPLNWIFSMAELHRWHHSRVLEESNTNYGQNLIVWDIVFGTRYLPQDREPPDDIGLAGPSGFPMDYWGQLLSPIRWRAICAASVPRSEAPSATPQRAATRS
jgi:sterol desaturase/sphingolipid hydroxylase (fatty acid hydroxylase superfamily)